MIKNVPEDVLELYREVRKYLEVYEFDPWDLDKYTEEEYRAYLIQLLNNLNHS